MSASLISILLLDCTVCFQVGNKIDLVKTDTDIPRVTEEQAKSMALELDIPCVETSAKDGTNVDHAFTHVIEKIYSISQVSKQQANGTNKTATGASASGSSAAAGERRGSKVDLSSSGSAAPSSESKCCK